MEIEEPDVKFLMILTIPISVLEGLTFDYIPLELNTIIGDPSKNW
jgi:hypothetical protein